MNSSGIAPSVTGGPASPGGTGSSFSDLLADSERGPSPIAAQSGLAGPAGIASRAAEGGVQKATMPSDEEFLVIDDVETTTDETGEEVMIASGEAVEGEDAAAALAARKGGAVILPLSGPRLQARSISGSLFASMLLDQRSGELPNPFSMWRLPQSTAPAPTEQTGAITPVSEYGPVGAGIQDAPTQTDGLAVSKEISRLEAAISQLVLKLEQMLKSMRTLIGNLSKLYGGNPR